MVCALSAQTGSADISPTAISLNAYNPVINITYKPGTFTAFNSGSLEIIIPQEFIPAPSTANNNLTAVIMSGSVTVKVVSAQDIAIDGYAVTINALTLTPGQVLVVTYGNSGAGGIYPPSTQGKYYFNMAEMRNTSVSFTALDQQPYIYVTYVEIDKSSQALSVKAGDTVTYYIDYKNLDAVNNLSGFSAWDTLPQGMSLFYSAPTAIVNGNVLSWNPGTVLSSSAAVRITVVAKANAGIINFGDNCVNYASVSASHPTANLISMDAKKEIPVTGVRLTATLSAFPSSIVTNQNITLVMGITNEGNVSAAYVSGVAQVIADSGNALLYISPSPYSVNSLAAGATVMFTWIYRGTTAGTVHFSGQARGQENAFVVTSQSTGTDYVNITDPTPTYTPTPSPAATTVIPTATFTTSATPVITQPITPGVTVTPVTPTPIPAIPEKVKTDRNYINLTAGDKVEIMYTVESYGKSYIRIYNLNGEEIRGFYELTLAPGTYEAYWDGTNKAGAKVGKGVYFIAVTQPGGRTIRKIIVIK